VSWCSWTEHAAPARAGKRRRALVCPRAAWQALKMEINGIAHVMLTVADMARSRPFYVRLLSAMGLMQVVDTDQYLYYVGGRTAVGLRPAAPQFAAERFVQQRCGLHHVCFRARCREDVDAIYAVVKELGAHVVHSPEEAGWVPGYYSLLFEDPDGIRLEINHVPGRGVLEPGVERLEMSGPRDP
jgi:catechol 2,3-dioxygenase-like lactoylglutathione lyase family enzyme